MKINYFVILIAGLAILTGCDKGLDNQSSSRGAYNPGSAISAGGAECNPGQVEVKNVSARQDGNYTYITGILRHSCSMAVGVELKWTAFYADNNVAWSRDFWPNSTSNIPPNVDFPFEGMNSSQIPPSNNTILAIKTKPW